MSMQVVPESKRRIALFGLALTLALGAGLTWALARGAADPPRATGLILNENRQDRLAPAGDFANARLYHITDAPVIDSLPFTVEVEAVNEGEPRSAWGVWISTDGAETGGVLPLLITDQGYVLSPFGVDALQHEQFMHITAVENRLTLHVDANGVIAFRINDEVVRTLEQSVRLPLDFGVALLGDVRLREFNLRVYAADEL